jgi:hypothetical protein
MLIYITSLRLFILHEGTDLTYVESQWDDQLFLKVNMSYKRGLIKFFLSLIAFSILLSTMLMAESLKAIKSIAK